MPRNELAAGSAICFANRPGFLGALARFCQRSYAADYVALISVIVGWIWVSCSVICIP